VRGQGARRCGEERGERFSSDKVHAVTLRPFWPTCGHRSSTDSPFPDTPRTRFRGKFRSRCNARREQEAYPSSEPFRVGDTRVLSLFECFHFAYVIATVTPTTSTTATQKNSMISLHTRLRVALASPRGPLSAADGAKGRTSTPRWHGVGALGAFLGSKPGVGPDPRGNRQADLPEPDYGTLAMSAEGALECPQIVVR